LIAKRYYASLVRSDAAARRGIVSFSVCFKDPKTNKKSGNGEYIGTGRGGDLERGRQGEGETGRGGDRVRGRKEMAPGEVARGHFN